MMPARVPSTELPAYVTVRVIDVNGALPLNLFGPGQIVLPALAAFIQLYPAAVHRVEVDGRVGGGPWPT